MLGLLQTIEIIEKAGGSFAIAQFKIEIFGSQLLLLIHALHKISKMAMERSCIHLPFIHLITMNLKGNAINCFLKLIF